MEEKVKRLTAKRKFELFLEVKQNGANVGEILRRYGLHLSDLRRIEAQVEQAAVAALKVRRDNGTLVSVTDYSALTQELAQKEKALAELMVEYMLLKKRDFSVSKDLSKESMCMGSGGKR